MFTLLCLPHAGGSAAAYNSWRGRIPGVDVVTAELPGRGRRFREPAFRSFEELLGWLLAECGDLPEPYAVFGHSMGGLLAYEFARRRQVAGAPLPRRLFVSAFRPPHRAGRTDNIDRQRDDDDLIRALLDAGYIPNGVFKESDLREVFLPPLRADFDVLGSYRFVPEPMLRVPVTAVGGADDVGADLASLTGWSELTTEPVEVVSFPGGHFYLRDHETALLDRVATALAPRVTDQ